MQNPTSLTHHHPSTSSKEWHMSLTYATKTCSMRACQSLWITTKHSTQHHFHHHHNISSNNNSSNDSSRFKLNGLFIVTLVNNNEKRPTSDPQQPVNGLEY
eukprot:m.74277 g.74277  ORF g.74277 m.74277 type:complete len:101 (-) comp11795_c0_seq2:742-1044(-)